MDNPAAGDPDHGLYADEVAASRRVDVICR
jgi:hypothetical protein